MSDNQPTIRLCLVLHNHQPVGNFEDVFERSYATSYLPFIELFESFSQLRISLHVSGPLMLWLQTKHPEYLSRIGKLVELGRIEVLGGAFYEPVLPMIPTRDRIGQIEQYSDWLVQRICPSVKGMWIPERVWESSLTSAIADSGIKYTVLDDFHFRRAGLLDEQLTGYFVTEDDGRTLSVFPGSERLRYLIPFGEPHETIDHCRNLAEQCPNSVVVFGDDGEKFGSWPGTHDHVYRDGWLQRFFEALTENRDWLHTTTLGEAIENTPPKGKVYLPDGSYREMTEWALPVQRQIQFGQLADKMKHDPRWSQIQSFASGGFWRNFKIKYPETNEMYSRMMYVSRSLEQAAEQGVDPSALDLARDHLYQGQCNCAYWHGTFGGVYMPHLRNAVYQNLLTAESIIDQASGKPSQWVEATSEDYNFDGRRDIRLANDQGVAWISPHCGGQIYELDVRSLAHNLGATVQRRRESYHDAIRDDPQADERLRRHLSYDPRMPNTLVDHFWDDDVDVSAIAENRALERGDFADGQYVATIRRKPERIQVMLVKNGNAWGVPITVTKGITMNQGSDVLEIAYLLEGLPPERPLHFGVDFNFAGLPAGQDDRYFVAPDGTSLGDLGTTQDLADINQLGLVDRWLGLNVQLNFDQLGGIYTYPIQTVSQSNKGPELVHQSVCVQPHWIVTGDLTGRWVCRMQLKLENTDRPAANDEVLATHTATAKT